MAALLKASRAQVDTTTHEGLDSPTSRHSRGRLLFYFGRAGPIPYAGIEEDESLFAIPVYRPVVTEFWIRLFGHGVPLMLMSYLHWR